VLELAQFDERTKSLEFYEIVFPPGGAGDRGRSLISEPNPAKCASCHGNPARFIWDSWTLWPGAYRGEVEELYPGLGERADYAEFERYTRSNRASRYRFLVPRTLSGAVSPLGAQFSSVASGKGARPNLSLDFLTSGLMGERVVAEIAGTTELRSYRYAILGTLSCDLPVQTYLPTYVAKAMPRGIDDLVSEVTALARAEQSYRLRSQKKLRRGSPVARYNVEAEHWPRLSTRAVGNNGDVERIARMRYIIEGTLGAGAMVNWFTPFNDNKASYSAVDITDWEAHAWKALLDPVTDADLLELYRDAWPKLRLEQVPSWIHSQHLQPTQSKLCPLLQERSLAALSERS
jgi:hypothetical protein